MEFCEKHTNLNQEQQLKAAQTLANLPATIGGCCPFLRLDSFPWMHPYSYAVTSSGCCTSRILNEPKLGKEGQVAEGGWAGGRGKDKVTSSEMLNVPGRAKLTAAESN